MIVAAEKPLPPDAPPAQLAKASAAAAAPQRVSPGILAFDFGEKYIGVAVGDRETGLAHPLDLIEGEANALRFGRIEALIAEWRPGSLAVGLPLSMDGSEHDQTRRARKFARQLEGRFGMAVVLVDERLSSVAAEESLRNMGRGGRANKHHSHALAAQIILQGYLDEQARQGRDETGEGNSNAAA